MCENEKKTVRSFRPTLKGLQTSRQPEIAVNIFCIMTLRYKPQQNVSEKAILINQNESFC